MKYKHKKCCMKRFVMWKIELSDSLLSLTLLLYIILLSNQSHTCCNHFVVCSFPLVSTLSQRNNIRTQFHCLIDNSEIDKCIPIIMKDQMESSTFVDTSCQVLFSNNNKEEFTNKEDNEDGTSTTVTVSSGMSCRSDSSICSDTDHNEISNDFVQECISNELVEGSNPHEETINTSSSNKKIYGIRHGKSLANEWMELPGNRWGDPDFYDDVELRDARLAPKGIEQATLLSQELIEQLLLAQQQLSESDNDSECSNNEGSEHDRSKSSLYRFNNNNIWNHDKNDANINHHDWLSQIELVIISPLTRCLQTWKYGVLPALQRHEQQQQQQYGTSKKPTVIVLPLVREQIFTASDTGRSLHELSNEFNNEWIDWDQSIHIHTEQLQLCPNEWWYQPSKLDKQQQNQIYEDWRPNHANQYYAVDFEPHEIFHERMKQLDHFLLYQRSETNILLITHWGVLRHYTGDEIPNCGIVQIIHK